ncbi:sporulation protein [Bacillus sp. V3B]|uniref:sporulation protein n=1 Tax=Bacillus sp. V3B TaxID=2804915 RepID=UPI00210D8606|nr:sporulation protein [Bacillus sp. V3B]MCQ6276618.1 sporulation protein [Bacillus sp. V3B]
MSFFNKVLASIGIGAATVDTKLEKDQVVPGEEIKGIVDIRGGNVEQQIDDIYLSINTQYIKESDDKKYYATETIERIRLASTLTLAANERREIPFSFQLPLDTPVTVGKTKVWVTTGLDIKNAVDPSDKDFLHVKPNRLLEGVIDSISSLGFRLREVECEQASRSLRGRLPFIQEFEFVPTSGVFRGRLDELELVFLPTSQTSADLHFQIDRKARGLKGFLSEALEMDETNIRSSISISDLATFPQKLRILLQKYA